MQLQRAQRAQGAALRTRRSKAAPAGAARPALLQLRLPRASADATATAAAAPSPASQQQQQKRRDDLLRTVRDFYAALYDFDLPVAGLVDQEVVLEDDALQVALKGPEAVGDYLRWRHSGVGGGEPATATVDGGPLEKAVLAGAEAVLADEMAAAAAKAGFEIHAHEGDREDAVIASWVGSGSGQDEEVLGRDEFFFAAAGDGGSGDPLIVRIHTSRTSTA